MARHVKVTKAAKPKTIHEHDFVGTLEEWEERVFLRASHFRLHRISFDNTKRDTNETENFEEAMHLALASLEERYRVMVYALTESGRYFCIPQERWPSCLVKWRRKVETGA